MTPATSLSFSDITIDYQGGSPIVEYCMEFVQYVRAVNINNLNCSNMWAGIAPYEAVSGAFNDFTVTNSHFTNIATNGIETFGQWSVVDNRFESITGSAIVADSGVTTVSENRFTNIGTDMYSAGGSFVVLTH